MGKKEQNIQNLCGNYKICSIQHEMGIPEE